jgi:hexosaminidase
LESEIAGSEIVCTTNGTMPDINSEKYTQPITIKQSCVITALPVFNGQTIGNPLRKEIFCHKALGKDIVYQNFPNSKYRGTSNMALVDGIHGSTNFADGYWQGFFGQDCNVTIDLKTPQKISEIVVAALQYTTSWIFFPANVTCYLSNDNETWILGGTVNNSSVPSDSDEHHKTFTVQIANDDAFQYLRVVVESPKTCPQEHPVEGNPCWIFIDEIEVK